MTYETVLNLSCFIYPQGSKSVVNFNSLLNCLPFNDSCYPELNHKEGKHNNNNNVEKCIIKYSHRILQRVSQLQSALFNNSYYLFVHFLFVQLLWMGNF